MSVTNKVVLVTGAARGIGRAVAQRLAQQGGRVAVHYNRDRSAAEETLASLSGGPHQLFQANPAGPRIVAFPASGQANFATGSIIDVNGASYLRT